jgi:replication factor C subunit 1
MSFLNKYRPKTLSEICGNKTLIIKAKSWIYSFSKKKPDSVPILYIHGPSGIGKTLLAHLLLREYNFSVFEMNAGEIRSKKRIEEIFEKITSNDTINFSGKNGSAKQIGLLMDEIDGMSCGDKGGLHYLIDCISSKQQLQNPLICISNKPFDKKSQQVEVLELRMVKPPVSDIIELLNKIIKGEALNVEQEVLNLIVSFSKNDIRKSILTLQEIVTFTNKKIITLDDYTAFSKSLLKQKSEMNLFDVTTNIFNHSLSFEGINNLCNKDINLVPSMVYENIPVFLSQSKLPVKNQLQVFTDLTSNFVVADILDKHMYLNQRWEILTLNQYLKCSEPNVIFPGLHYKSSHSKTQVVFTSSLSRSATQVSNFNVLTLLTMKLGVTMFNIENVFESICFYMENDNPNLITQDFKSIEFGDIEKFFQVYQLPDELKKYNITPKKKKELKLLFK